MSPEEALRIIAESMAALIRAIRSVSGRSEPAAPTPAPPAPAQPQAEPEPPRPHEQKMPAPLSFLTLETLMAASGMSAETATRWLPHLHRTADLYAINTPERMAAFVAQVGHESIGFTHLEENLNYTKAETIVSVFKHDYDTNKNRVIDPAELEFAKQFIRQPEKLANFVYANQNGNGPVESGDGWKFRGRGLLQVTGRENYEACGKALGVDFLEAPAALALPSWACLSAGWYWSCHRLNDLADSGDFETMTRRINGGLNGLDDRKARLEKARAAFVGKA